MTPEDLIDELCHKVALAPDERELEAALGELQSCKITTPTWRVSLPIIF
jgi:hypothetical protein